MKRKASQLSLRTLFCLGFLAAISTYATDIAGPAIVTGGSNGTLDADGPLVSFGTIGTAPGISLIFSDSSATSGTTGDTLTFSANRTSASWLWLHNASKSAMRLNSLHQLLLYQADGSTAGITLTPASNQLSLGSATLTGSGLNLLAGGGLTVASGITNTNGVFTGGASGLSLNAGSAGQNITLTTPTGAGDIVFNTNGIERARIKSTGNVGIGTSSPVAPLTVVGQVVLRDYDASVGGQLQFYNKSATSGFLLRNTGSTGASVLQFTKDTTDVLTVSNAGNVGIGTTVPNAKLEIQPTGVNVGIRLKNAGASTNWDVYAYSDGNFYLNNANGSVINVTANAAANLLYLTGGSVGIGTTSPGTLLELNPGTAYANYPTIKVVSSYADGYNAQIELQNTHTGGRDWLVRAGNNASGGVSSNFQIYDKTASLARLDITAGGNIGIGTISPQARLQLGSFSDGVGETTNHGDLLFSKQNTSLAATGGIEWKIASDNYGAKIDTISAGGANLVFGLRNGSTAWTESMRINPAGNVGIGTTNPTQKLSVAGTIRAHAVVVDTGWSDYVFDQDYRLASLSEVEAHIKAEKHLPGIPSASEVAEHGVSLGEMQSKLLAKVEELTLHLIAQEKEIASLRQQVSELKSNSR